MLVQRVLLGAAMLGLLTVGVAPTATAHETREISGTELVVGWAEEPTYVGVLNAVQLLVYETVGEGGERGEPLEGLAGRLQVEVTLGDETTGPLELRSVFGSPGEYRADVIPTRPGAYSFHFTGEIDGEPIDETFSPPGFDEVRSSGEIEFPEPAPSRAELAQALEGIEGRAEGGAPAADDGLARTLGGAGLALGLVALVVAAVSFARRKGASG